MALHQADEQPMAEFRALLDELTVQTDIAGSQDLRALALGATGHHDDDPLEAIHAIELVTDGPQPGDLLERRFPAEGVMYFGVIVGDYVGTADVFAARGITVEAAGPGLFVEVAEVPFGGGGVSYSARRITDPSGGHPRGQTIYRPRGVGTAGRVDDDDQLFESEELVRHVAYGLRSTAPASYPGASPAMMTATELRQAWAPYECAAEGMARLRLFGQWDAQVNRETVDAWYAFERALLAAGYQPHGARGYDCRQIPGQRTRSLHAYGLAVDLDPDEPAYTLHRSTADGRDVLFSEGSAEDDRRHDVRRGVADTSFTPEQVEAVEAIQTVDGYQVFAWGGRWRTTKATMHFQINVPPTDLSRGIRPDRGSGGPDRAASLAADIRTPDHIEATDESLAEGDDDYAIRGGRYTPAQKQQASTHPAGLLLTSSVIGLFEQRLAGRAPYALSVSKEWTRFGSGRLGDFVADYNDFTHYFGEVLAAIGRLQDLLSAGAPEVPTLMTPAQKQALRPTSDRSGDADKKILYRQWREEQAKYADAEGGIVRGLVFEVAYNAARFDELRHGFWQAAGELKRTIDDAKRLGTNKPTYEALELSLSDALALADPVALAAKGVDLAIDAYQKRKEYDEKMSQFAAGVGAANSEVRDRFERLRDVQKAYWAALLRYRQSARDRDRARVEARQKGALLGQRLASAGETRSPVLAEIRMPVLVADAWRALAVIGPPARAKLQRALAARAVVEEASRHDLSWRPQTMSGPPADPFADITQIRLAWQRANSWTPVLTAEEVAEWTAANTLWDEVFTRFNV